MQDLRLADRPTKIVGQFGMVLLEQLAQFGVPETIFPYSNILSRFDWQPVKAQLVMSLPGMHRGQRCFRLGLGGLMKATRGMESPSTMDYVGSSLGKMTKDWISSLKQATGNENAVFRLLFPTCSYARQHPDGARAFATMFCRREVWDHCPDRSIFHRMESTIVPHQPVHAKIITASNLAGSPLWAYVGSHNCTASAWGRWGKDGHSLMIANYELGVIVTDLPVPLPYRTPPTPYAPDDLPFIQEEHFP